MSVPPSPQHASRQLHERCKQLGIPLTVQRRAVFETLAARDDHPTADELFTSLAARLPGISKATAYRTLDKLVELGLVVRVSHPAAVARYDAKTNRHHHLVCDGCGAISDLESRQLDALALPDLAPNGFQTRDFSVHVRGLCRACVAARDGGRSRPAAKSRSGRDAGRSAPARGQRQPRRKP